MEYNQSFLAPSIPKPKLSKSNISSSVLRSGAVAKALSTQKPQLKTSTFNFSRKRETGQGSQLSVDAGFISSSLVETNRILVEIQKQLSLDFASRIAEQQNLLKTAKIQREKQSRARKEFSLEKFGGVAKRITGLFAPITRPVKSIFDNETIIFSYVSFEFVVTMPASPKAPRFLVGKKLKHPASPKDPTLLPSHSAPCA